MNDSEERKPSVQDADSDSIQQKSAFSRISQKLLSCRTRFCCSLIRFERRFSAVLHRFGRLFTRYLVRVGANMSRLLSLLFLNLALGFKSIGRLFLHITRRPRAVLSDAFSRVREFFTRPFRQTKEAFTSLQRHASDACAKNGVCSAAKACVVTIGKGAWSRKRALVTLFNYAAPAICIAFLYHVIAYGTSLTYAISVECNGEQLGYIATESDYNEAEKIMQERIVYVDGNEPVKTNPTFRIEQVDDTRMLSANSLADLLLTHTNQKIEKLVGVYIDGQFFGTLKSANKLQSTLDGLLNEARAKYPGAEVSFAKSISMRAGMYLSASLRDEDDLVELFSGQTQVDTYYTVVKGDTPSGIAQKNGVSYSELKALNSSIESSLLIGQQVKLQGAKPYLSIVVKRVEDYTESISYETEQVEDSSKYKGVVTVLQKGVNGEAAVSAKVSYVDGAEVSREVLTREVTKDPVTKKMSVGTKQPSKGASTASAGGGYYIWPVGGGSISSGYGYRWGKLHAGVDIAAPAGTPIYAGASGTVKMARTYADYGKCIIIQHDNGMQTLYGHASALYVTEGQRVTQGDVIAAVGRTGRSTGNHLHFEVHVNGVRKNPSNYVDWY